jgi:hypothetical protein
MVPVRTGAVWVSDVAGVVAGAGAWATTGGAARTTGAAGWVPGPVRLTTGAGAFVLQAVAKRVIARTLQKVGRVEENRGLVFNFIGIIPKLSRTFATTT